MFAVKLEQTVGELTAIRIGHDNTGLGTLFALLSLSSVPLSRAIVRLFCVAAGPAWFLTRVEVVDEAYEEAYHFFIRQWLQDDILEKKLPVKAVHVMGACAHAPFLSPTLTLVCCVVHLGRALALSVMEARDLSLKNPYDLPDPYCRISYGPQHTTVKPARNTVNPLWEYGVTSLCVLRVRGCVLVALTSHAACVCVGLTRTLCISRCTTRTPRSSWCGSLTQQAAYPPLSLIPTRLSRSRCIQGRLRIPLHHAVPGDIIDEWFELDTNPDETRDAVPAFEGAEAVADEDLGRERTRSRPGTLTPVGKPSEAKKDEKKDGKSEEKAKKDSIKLNKEKSAEKTDSPKADKRRTLTDKKEKKEKSDKDKKVTPLFSDSTLMLACRARSRCPRPSPRRRRRESSTCPRAVKRDVCDSFQTRGLSEAACGA